MRRTLLFETHMNADGQCRINVLRSFSYNACLPVECLLSFFFFLVFASTLYALSQRIVILSVREINPPLVCRSSSVSFVCPLAHGNVSNIRYFCCCCCCSNSRLSLWLLFVFFSLLYSACVCLCAYLCAPSLTLPVHSFGLKFRIKYIWLLFCVHSL